MRKNIKRRVCLVGAILAGALACLAVFGGCRGPRVRYWDYPGSWVCQDPQIELYEGCGSGKMILDQVEIEFFTAQANDATDITFFETSAFEEEGEQKVIWVADTELKDGKLYLTVTEDHLSDFEGKTLVFLPQEE